MTQPTWILLRGLMREQRHWGDFPATLARALPGASIVTPDLPGNGRRHAQDSATRVADMVAACRQDLRRGASLRRTTCWPCRWAAWWPSNGLAATRRKSPAAC